MYNEKYTIYINLCIINSNVFSKKYPSYIASIEIASFKIIDIVQNTNLINILIIFLNLNFVVMLYHAPIVYCATGI